MATSRLKSEIESTDVIICGCGPTGALLSAALGRHGVKNVVLERELDVTEDPRGIALDEDGIRYLQAVGLYDQVFSRIGQKMTYFNFISSATDLYAKPFLKFNYQTIEGGTGHPGFMCHKQPSMERCLREVIASQPQSDLRCGSTVSAIEETHENVTVTYTTSTGKLKKLQAKYLVGADGKTGFTRKNYLEPKGITMMKDEKFKYEEVWVALNWKISPPSRERHPHFPLWNLGYTPDQVYDAFFPQEFRFICNPDRPSVCGRFGLPEDRLWRFEFVVKEGEDGLTMAEYSQVREVVYPYLTHSGKKYGLDTDVKFPEDCIEVIRSRPFTFSARSCNKWSLGRVLLCGDSAHVFPPFGGQGIASGFRDAISVAWRLAIACRPSFHQHEKLFEAWYGERKQQLEKSLAATIVNGNFCNERSTVKTFVRDWYLWFLQLVPSWRHTLELGQRAEGMTRYKWESGYPFLPGRNGGKSLPQVFCLPCYKGTGQQPLFTDDVIFQEDKNALFQIVVLLATASDLSQAVSDLAWLDKLDGGELDANEATFLVSGSLSTHAGPELNNCFRIIESDTSDPGIWGSLPSPQGYDGSRMAKEMQGRYVIVRPDRFVFAVCNSGAELVQDATALSAMFSNSRVRC